MHPFLIGIAGPSGSGKSELSRELGRSIPGVAVLSLDSYYRPLDHLSLEQRAEVNFDHPDSLDWALFERHIEELSRGAAIEEPVYLFDRHTRAERTHRVQPGRYVIVEGIMALLQPEVRARLGLRVYVETPDAICFARRLKRDVRDRGRTAESVEWQYKTTVQPMARDYVWPTRAFADLEVSGTDPIANATARVLAALAERTSETRGLTARRDAQSGL